MGNDGLRIGIYYGHVRSARHKGEEFEYLEGIERETRQFVSAFSCSLKMPLTAVGKRFGGVERPHGEWWSRWRAAVFARP